MSRLFIDLYLDEDVDILLATLLSSQGFDVLTTLVANQTGQSDPKQLAFAARAGRAIVTHNRVHFAKLAKEVDGHAGIIIAKRRASHELARRLLLLLDSVTSDEMMNQVRYI